MTGATLVDIGLTGNHLTCNAACLTHSNCEAFVMQTSGSGYKCYLFAAGACAPNIADTTSITYQKLNESAMNNCKMAFHKLETRFTQIKCADETSTSICDEIKIDVTLPGSFFYNLNVIGGPGFGGLSGLREIKVCSPLTLMQLIPMDHTQIITIGSSKTWFLITEVSNTDYPCPAAS